MLLRELLEVLKNKEIVGEVDKDINSISYDSRKVELGSMFVAVKGFQYDGHDYIKEAIEKGVSVVVTNIDKISTSLAKSKPKITFVKVPDSRQALALLANKFYDFPSRKLNLIGITGTNGKTTTSYLVESVLKHAGQKVAGIGTINYRIGNKVFIGSNTTPESLDLQELFHKMVIEEIESVVLEVSSHALALNRVMGCKFDTAVYTNLSLDHLDFHKTMEEYFSAKMRLFSDFADLRMVVINVDDPWGRRIIDKTSCKVLTYGINSQAGIMADRIECSIEGINFLGKTPAGEINIESKLIGEYNLYNLLAAIGAGLSQDIDLSDIKKGVEALRVIPGRCEKVDAGQDFAVIVDYAHSPDALEKILQTMRKLTKGKVIVIFGCGGNRDKTKRPLMGEIAAKYSDYAIITSDNPRDEDSFRIMVEIEEGFKKVCLSKDRYILIEDRGEGISCGIKLAEKGDIVLIAGKGHEDYQIIGKKIIHFDDRETAKNILKKAS